MKTIADKNRIETELRRTPSNIGVGKDRKRKSKRMAKWMMIFSLCVIAGWFVYGVVKMVVADTDITVANLLTAFLILRWLFVRRVSAIKTIILTIVATTIF